MSLFCPSDLCPFSLLVSLLLTAFITRGALCPLYIWENKTLFVTFQTCVSLCSDTVQKCMMGGQIILFASNQLFLLLWTNSSRGLWEGKRVEGEGEQDQDSNTFLCFYLTFNDHDVETCWRQSSGCWLLCSLEWFGFFLRMTNSWRGPMIECVWLSLATPSSPIDGLKWECVGCLQMEVLFFFF